MPLGTMSASIYSDTGAPVSRAGFVTPDGEVRQLRVAAADVVSPATLDSIAGGRVSYTESLGVAINVAPA